MGCTPFGALSGITFDCTDRPKGGIRDIIVARRSDVSATLAAGVLTVTAITNTAKLDFNKKDGISYAGTEYAGEADGTDKYTPTVMTQFPVVAEDKLEAIQLMLGGFQELVVFVMHQTGKAFAYGWDNGMYGSAVTTNSGTNNDKNVIDLTFTGDEDSFEKDVTASWDVISA